MEAAACGKDGSDAGLLFPSGLWPVGVIGSGKGLIVFAGGLAAGGPECPKDGMLEELDICLGSKSRGGVVQRFCECSLVTGSWGSCSVALV